MPAALGDGGLRATVRSLLRHIALPVSVQVMPDRLPAQAETTAYFVVAEALTNPVRHARATGATVRAAVRHGALELEIREDGAGGADPRHGTGLTGLADRVESIGGTITLTSPPGTGTTITARLPAEWPADADVAGNANRRATDSPTRESLPGRVRLPADPASAALPQRPARP